MKTIFCLGVTLFLVAFSFININAAQTDIVGPAGSGLFGQSVTVLPNGNFVVTDPGYDAPGPISNVGAVYLYDGTTLSVISTLTGTAANDAVGNAGITQLTNGNFLVGSYLWNGTRGAVTFCSAVVGCNGVVSSDNSLVGSTANDNVGLNSPTPLTNGNYVARTPFWNDGAIADVGAVTWGDGEIGTVGPISAANSLVGSTANDQVGTAVTALTNGNYVTNSWVWDNPSPLISNVGAATWGNGTTGTFGAVSAVNSLVGSIANDQVGIATVPLTNGNYVVRSHFWDSGLVDNVGAVTWGNGSGGTVGLVSAANSLVGGTASDQVGNVGVVPLTNGNYVVVSSNWDKTSPAISGVGAVTWGNGIGGTIGLVSESNSLIGSTANDQVGNPGVTALANGNYVIRSTGWSNGALAGAGAATWGNGTTGTIGVVSSLNSLVGSTISDQIGLYGVVALTNGNYVVCSPAWNNGAIADAGAATWGNGASGIFGTVSAANSLVGSVANDNVGNGNGAVGAFALTNGNYVVTSQAWNNGSVVDAGAATWGNGTTGTTGAVSASNSLVGSTADNRVGVGGVVALANGNFVVRSPDWDNGAVTNVGAATWRSGAAATNASVSSSNSLIGSTTNDFISSNNGVLALSNGNYVVNASVWNNGANTDAGAATWGNGTTGVSGTISSSNSLVGTAANSIVSSSGFLAFPNGNYLVLSPSWDGAFIDVGAYTFGNGATGTSGPVTSGTSGGNSVVGTVPSGVTSRSFDPTLNRLFVGRMASNTVSILSFSTTAITDGDITNAANWSAGVPNGLVTGIIPNGRTMSVSTKVNAGMIHVQCGGSLTGGSSTAYVIGSIRRDFCSAADASVLFPVGDPTNYSPMTSSGVNGSGNLTVSAIDGFMPGIAATATSLSRYWSLSGSGIVADLTFQYIDADVNGTEANYRVFRRPIANNSLVTQHPTDSVNTSLNTVTAWDVSQFSDWTASAQLLAPTSAGVSVSGRLLSPSGFGVRNAEITLTKANGEVLRTNPSSFGYFRFDDLEAGQTVIVSIASKQYQFTPRTIQLVDDIYDLEFTAGSSSILK